MQLKKEMECYFKSMKMGINNAPMCLCCFLRCILKAVLFCWFLKPFYKQFK